MPTFHTLAQNNRAWAARRQREDPAFFSRLEAQQAPKFLWIGCADSRVPANEVVGLDPGELFVHRNVANVVVHTDLNCLSVLQYAVDVLEVEHVIVCGHYGCGGVRAAWQAKPLGLIDNWLRHVQDAAEPHREVLSGIQDDDRRLDLLCEINVLAQLRHVARTTIVQDAWQRGQRVVLHGWIYGLKDGLLEDLGITLEAADQLDATYAPAVAARIARATAG